MFTKFTLWVSSNQLVLLPCPRPQTGGLCISVAAHLFSFFQHLDCHRQLKFDETTWKYQEYPYLPYWSSVVDGAHIQIAQRQWLLSILCHFPAKELMYWDWSKEFKRASFSLPSSVVAALAAMRNVIMVTRQPTPVFMWGLYPPLVEKQKSSFLELLSSR